MPAAYLYGNILQPDQVSDSATWTTTTTTATTTTTTTSCCCCRVTHHIFCKQHHIKEPLFPDGKQRRFKTPGQTSKWVSHSSNNNHIFDNLIDNLLASYSKSHMNAVKKVGHIPCTHTSFPCLLINWLPWIREIKRLLYTNKEIQYRCCAVLSLQKTKLAIRKSVDL